MKNYLVAALLLLSFAATAQVTTIKPGESAPGFTLKNVDGKEVSFSSFSNAKGYIVVFTCNTCPYAKRYEQRIIELNDKYAPLGYPVIAINPNDPELSEEDSYESMQAVAKSKQYKFPYLFDKGQATTNQYGARNTPQVFLVSKTASGNTIEYTGAIDNDPQDVNPDKIKYVEQAITALQKNAKPDVTVTKAIGCSIKRRS